MNSLCLCCRRHRGLSTLSTTSLLRRAPPVSCFRNRPQNRPGRLPYDTAAEIISKTRTDMAVNKYCSRPYTVFVEGNVGSGKTTFLEQFADCPNVFLAKEPVHKWQDVRGHNFLVSKPSSSPAYYTRVLCVVSFRFSPFPGTDVRRPETVEFRVPVDCAEDHVGTAPSQARTTRSEHQDNGTLHLQRPVNCSF